MEREREGRGGGMNLGRRTVEGRTKPRKGVWEWRPSMNFTLYRPRTV